MKDVRLCPICRLLAREAREFISSVADQRYRLELETQEKTPQEVMNTIDSAIEKLDDAREKMRSVLEAFRQDDETLHEDGVL